MKPLDWIKAYPEMDDATSLRHMHSFARAHAAEAKRLMRLLRKQPEDAESFKPDFDEAVEAMRLIEARLEALGFTL